MKRLLLLILLLLPLSIANAQAPVAIINNGTSIIGGTTGQCVTRGANGLVLLATCGGAPSGAAGGDLAGTYPNPTIKASVSLTTPNINVATGTSLALGGATIGTNLLAGTGSGSNSGTWSVSNVGNIVMTGLGAGAGSSAGTASITMGSNSGTTPASITYAGNTNAVTYSVGRTGVGSDHIWSNGTAEMMRLIFSAASQSNLRLGPADASAPGAQTFSVQNVVAGTSNTSGATMTFQGSRSTGSATGGSLIFQTSPAGGAGSGQNTLVTALTIAGSGAATFAGTMTALDTVTQNVATASAFRFPSSSRFLDVSDGVVRITNSAATGFTRLILGTNDTSGFALKKNGANVDFTDGSDTVFTSARMLNLTLNSYIAGIEEAEPAAPAANGGRIFFKDNGSGKTQFCVKFATGPAQCPATEP